MRSPLRPLGLLLVLVFAGGFEWDGRLIRLERELSSAEPARRAEIVRLLGAHPGAGTSEALVGALDDPSPLVRAEAVAAVGRARITAAAPRLAALLEDEAAPVRVNAARALGELGDASTRGALVRALGDGEPSVRREAVLALSALADREAVVPALSALDDDDDSVRVAAAEGLARMGDERAVVPLVGRARDDVPEVREAVARALGELGSTRAIPGLLPSLEDSNEAVRLAAVSALGRLRDARGVEPLAPLLDEQAPRLRQAAIAALGAIGGDRAMGLVVAALADEHVRRAASDVLVAASPEQVLPILGRALRSAPERELATAIVEVLVEAQAERGEPALARPLLEALEDGRVAPPTVHQALARTGAPEALLPLLRAAEHADVEASIGALAALEAYFARAPPDTRAVDPLLALLERRSELPASTRIARLLGVLGAPRATPALVSLLGSSDSSVRLAAVSALGRIGGAEAGALAPLLDDPEAEVRYRAARALGRTADAQQVVDLLDRLEGRRPADRHALLVALGDALPRLSAGGGLRRALEKRAAKALRARLVARDLEAAARALDVARRWQTQEAFAVVELGLRHRSAAIRRQAARALGAFDLDAARAAARARAFGREPREAAAAAVALGEIGGADDAKRLLEAARARPWPFSGAASFALTRLARRGLLDATSTRPVCALAKLREPYVRANALATLAVIGAPGCRGLEPAALLRAGHDPAVRAAAARWLGVLAERGDAASADALARCANDLLPELRAACAAPALPALGGRPAEVFAYDSTGRELVRDRLMALRLADGAVLVANTDRNGHVWLERAPEGPLLLEDPTAAALEP